MKTLIYAILMVLTFGWQTTQAGCSLGCPGVPVGTQSASACPFKKSVTLPGCYKFSFTGCQGKGTAASNSGGSGGTRRPNNNYWYYYRGWWYYDSNDDNWYWDGNQWVHGTNPNGDLEYIATCNDDKPTPTKSSCSVKFKDVTDFNSAPIKTTSIPTACVFRADKVPMKVTCTWQCDKTASKPDGVFNIIAEYQVDPPPPTGNLTFAVGSWLLVAAGTQPPGVAVVTRE